MSNFVENLKKGRDLSFEESKALFNKLMEGKYDENSIIEILESLTKKGETKDELAGGIFVLREKATKVKADQNTIDTCGTGGDRQNSLNISTAAAIVLASMGVKVAKHGNKAVSSNCGSADVLEALKININLKPNEAEESIKNFNFAFIPIIFSSVSINFNILIGLLLPILYIWNFAKDLEKLNPEFGGILIRFLMHATTSEIYV